MSIFGFLDLDVIIVSVAFSETDMEVTFLESRKQYEDGGDVTVRRFPTQNYMDDVLELQQLIASLVDRVEEDRREDKGPGSFERAASQALRERNANR
jgi:hypothetical protein